MNDTDEIITRDCPMPESRQLPLSMWERIARLWDSWLRMWLP